MSLIYQKHLILPQHSVRDVIFSSNSKVKLQNQVNPKKQPKNKQIHKLYTEEQSTLLIKVYLIH